MGAKVWKPERATCRHCGEVVFKAFNGNWTHLDNNSLYCEVKPSKAEPITDGGSVGVTPHGFDRRWVECINQVLADRGLDLCINDLEPEWWDEFIGPMCDRIEEEGGNG